MRAIRGGISSADMIAAAERWGESADKNKEADCEKNHGRLFYSKSIQYSVESLPKSRPGAGGDGGEAVWFCKIYKQERPAGKGF
jgi:hypothetical protein